MFKNKIDQPIHNEAPASSVVISGSMSTHHSIPVFKNVNHLTKAFDMLNTMRKQHLLCDVTVRVGNKDILGKFNFNARESFDFSETLKTLAYVCFLL